MEVKFTFGISTTYSDMGKLKESINSILAQNIPDNDFEILVIGSKKLDPEGKINYIQFDESKRKGWITRKKNILAEEAKFENVVICNDYFIFKEGFYQNYIEFGEDWEVCSNPQLYINGQRVFHDWCTFDHPNYPWGTMVDYDDWNHVQYQFQAGGYVLVKKETMRKYPFNEKLLWGQEEDVEWSKRIRTTCKYICNPKSIVQHNKHHHTFPYRHHRSVKRQ